MPVAHQRVEVDGTAVALNDADNDNYPVRSLSVQNEGAVTAYLGGAGVTSSDYGYALPAGGSFACDLAVGEQLHAITAGSSTTLNLLTLGA